MRWTLTVWTYCWEVRTHVRMIFLMFSVLYFLYYVYVCGACTYRAQACAVAYSTNVYVFLSVDCLFICPVISMMPFHFWCVCLSVYLTSWLYCVSVCLSVLFLNGFDCDSDCDCDCTTVHYATTQFITIQFFYVSHFFPVWSSLTSKGKFVFFIYFVLLVQSWREDDMYLSVTFYIRLLTY